VRFLPEYDNALLAHSDRARFVSDAGRDFLRRATGPFKGSALVDGEVQAIWYAEPDQGHGVVLVVEHARLTRRARSELEREAERVAAFWLADATSHEVRLVQVA
jgi:hypothetical protein